MYTVPDEYYIRLHHVRPRFKGDIENVLIYMASEIAKLPELPSNEFAERVNAAVRLFPGNATSKLKTINNWRTEISSLFGFIENDGTHSKCGLRARELSENEDLVESFKVFLFNFQYPGAHIKSHSVLELIENGVHFKPAQYILKMIQYAEQQTGGRVGITKAEVCHMIFNDLRVVRDNEHIGHVWERIKENRESGTEYDQTGDVIRYAGDIIDYMEIANLLITYDSRMYYLNTLENEAILKFVNSAEWFSEYDSMITARHGSLDAINSCRQGWFRYVNRELTDTDFSTDILAFIAEDSEEYEELVQAAHDLFKERLEAEVEISTKDIGDIGESLVHGHECERVRIGGRPDLVHLIKRIPTQFAVGYDISSTEIDERKRYIEVKTTISAKPLHFNKVHLTRNEWNVADSTKDRYFIYRLMLSKGERKLYLIQDPVGLYKKDIISMVPNNGADIIFNTDTAGIYEELLSWRG
ncbi:MAG: DUF3883 domain-containing protein [Clostridiaceae bacterium]|nr:DUF3883 domain-containing protein [Clostridiaceae bacterium]